MDEKLLNPMKEKLDEYIKAAEALKKECDDAEIGFTIVSEDTQKKILESKEAVAKIFFDASREPGLNPAKAKELAEKAHKILEEQKVELKDKIKVHIDEMEKLITGKKEEIPRMIARARKMLEADMPEQALIRANAAMEKVNALTDVKQKEEHKDDLEIIINQANKMIAAKKAGGTKGTGATDGAAAEEELEKKEMETIEKWCSENGLLGKEKLINETLAIMNIPGVGLKKEQLDAENPQIVQLIKETESTMLSFYNGAKGNKEKIKDLFAKCLAERKKELDEFMKSSGTIYQLICINKLLPSFDNRDYEVQKIVYFANKLMTIIIDHEEFVNRMK